MNRKFKMITAGMASLALITPIATVIACGVPKDKGDKMLSLDEARKWIIEGKLEEKGGEVTKAQNTHLKSIFDEFTLKTSKKYETTLKNKKDGNGDELIINSLSYMYLIEYSGNGLKLNDYFETEHENPNLDQRDPNEVKEENFQKDNFLKDENIGKYFLRVAKYTNKKTGKILKTEGRIFKIDKNGDKIALKGTDLFAMPEKMLSLDEVQTLVVNTLKKQRPSINNREQAIHITEDQIVKIKRIFDTFHVEKSKTFTGNFEDENGDSFEGRTYLYLITKTGDPLQEVISYEFDKFEREPGLTDGQVKGFKYIRDFLVEENLNKYLMVANKKLNQNDGDWASIRKIVKENGEIGLSSMLTLVKLKP